MIDLEKLEKLRWQAYNHKQEEGWLKKVREIVGGDPEENLCDDYYYDDCCLAWFIDGYQKGLKDANSPHPTPKCTGKL